MSMETFVEEVFKKVTIKQAPNGQFYYWPTADQHCWPGTIDSGDTPGKLAAHCNDLSCVVQAGGNAGFYVRRYAELFGAVYTFEPDPINFFCLTANTINYPNVIKFQTCVGNERKLVRMEMHPEDFGGGHVYEKDTWESQWHKKDEISRYPTLRIDDLNLPKCNLLQLDLEGYEYNALLGAEQTIDQHKPVICVEDFWSDRRYGVPIDTLITFLKRWNYEQVDEMNTDKVFKVK